MNSLTTSSNPPIKADTIYLGTTAIDYDLHVRKFETTTFNFSGPVKNLFRWKFVLEKDNGIRGITVKVNYESMITGSNGDLKFVTEVLFYLPPEKLPNAHYLMNFSINAGRIIKELLSSITNGFTESKNLKTGFDEMENTRHKWQKALECFFRSNLLINHTNSQLLSSSL